MKAVFSPADLIYFIMFNADCDGIMSHFQNKFEMSIKINGANAEIGLLLYYNILTKGVEQYE
ncbi:hypothetical protein AR543_20680 [Paenibacillus bovis]|uniref:Uncharacterized protein n=1 Tax=Paenibacillus bovis TaxID=1616788 RepID=A0A172ZKS3_9BACL|nr:hypothetical protein AR543_20680 [Paenibacillus bovis]